MNWRPRLFISSETRNSISSLNRHDKLTRVPSKIFFSQEFPSFLYRNNLSPWPVSHRVTCAWLCSFSGWLRAMLVPWVGFHIKTLIQRAQCQRTEGHARRSGPDEIKTLDVYHPSLHIQSCRQTSSTPPPPLWPYPSISIYLSLRFNYSFLFCCFWRDTVCIHRFVFNFFILDFFL